MTITVPPAIPPYNAGQPGSLIRGRINESFRQIGLLWETVTDLEVGGGYAPIDSPAFSGIVTAPQLGVNATPDLTNRLALSSPASLFNHEGAGHQLKINKAAAADTASLLFQTDFSGRAEMGTAGSDDFDIKVSPDGSTWNTALTADRASGHVTAPSRLSVAAGTLALPGLAVAGDDDTGIYAPAADQIALAAGGVQALLASTTALTAPLPIRAAAGTLSAPSISFAGNPTLGFYNPEVNVLEAAVAGVARFRLSALGIRAGARVIDDTGIDSTITNQSGGTAAGTASIRYSGGAAANAPHLTLGRAKSNTLGAYDAVAANDRLGDIRFHGSDGTNLATQGAGLRSTSTATATTGDVRANLQVLTRGSDGLQVRIHVADSTNVGIGTTSPTATLHVAGTLRVQTYTVATLPSASAVGNGGRAHVTDASATTFQSVVAGGGSNNVPVYSDGTNWRIG